MIPGTFFQSGTFFQAPVAPTVTTAKEGASLDGTAVVLGNDFGDPLQPALITKDREIPYSPGVGIFFTFPPNGNFTVISPTTHAGSNFAGDAQWQATLGSFTATDATGLGFPFYALQTAVTLVRLINEDGLASIQAQAPFNRSLRMDFINNRLIFGATGAIDNGASLQVPGEVTTGDPGSGQGAWQLGQVQAAAVVLDATRYVETTIDGVVVKLAIVN